MTEKRFIYDAEQVAILKNGGFWLEGAIATACNHSEICNELNKLVDENEQLKHHLSQQEMEYATDLHRLSEENEQLKKDCSNLIDDNTEYVAEMNHIKQVIKEAYNNERTHIGRNVLKQLLNNIGETNK